MLTHDQQNIELHSEEVQEIIGYVPIWIVRWGITLFFGALMLIISASWLIQYPDIVKAPFRLTSQGAPKAVHTKTDGILEKLFVQDNTFVQKDAVLAYLESTADHDEVLQLAKQTDTLAMLVHSGEVEQVSAMRDHNYNNLGELQSAYEAFDQVYADLSAFLPNGFYLTKKRILKQELIDLESMEINLYEQKTIYQKDFELAQQEFEVQQQLANEKIIAALEFKRDESKLLAKQMPLKQIESTILNNQAAQSNKLKELLDLDKFIAEQQRKFIQSLNTLRSAIEAWKQKYVLTAPLTGRVNFSTIVEEKQHLGNNQEIFFLAPESEAYFGTLRVPQQNLGKVRKGQRVLIKFSSYPYEEFGAVKGEIEFISEIPAKDSTFLAKVVLPDGLRTNFGKKITYKSGMNAVSEIITDDMRMLQRVFYSFHKAVER